MIQTAPTSVSPPSAKQPHPRGLYLLFFVEMWERFSFYGMVNLLHRYLVDHLQLGNDRATGITSNYLMFVYFTPLFGGMLADRKLGFSRSILIGGTFMMIGHFLMAIEHMTALYAALAFLCIGNGLFKPNISSMVGKLYADGDPRKDSAFTIFYMGINTGAFMGYILTDWLRENYGWHYGFAAAGVGMLFGLVLFQLLRKRLLGTIGDAPVVTAAAPGSRSAPATVTKRPLTQVERGRVVAFLVICSIVMLFWAAFHQNAVTLSLWAEHNTQEAIITLPLIGSFSMLPGYYGSLNSFFVILMSPVVAWSWSLMRRRNLEPSTPAKMGIGMTLTALSFAIMAFAALSGGNSGQVSGLWLASAYFVVTLAELCLSPIGLSLATKLAPVHMVGTMMGVWFMATALGNKLTVFGALWDDMPHSTFFWVLVGSSLFGAAVLFASLGRLKRWMAGVA